VKDGRGSVDRYEEYERDLGSSPKPEKTGIGDVTISGSARLPGFSGGSLDVSGSAQICGDVKVDRIRISGSARVDGNLQASSVKVSGSCLVNGNTDCGEVGISGSMRVSGDAILHGSQRVSGSTKVDGSFRGGNLRCTGLVKVARDLSVRSLEISGGAYVGGVTRADCVHIKVHSSDLVFDGEIEARNVKIELGGRPSRLRILGVSMGGRGRGHVKAPSIRCTGDVDIEQTICSYVEGSKVRIGPGCKIGRVAYRQDVIVEEGAELESEPERI